MRQVHDVAGTEREVVGLLVRGPLFRVHTPPVVTVDGVVGPLEGVQRVPRRNPPPPDPPRSLG